MKYFCKMSLNTELLKIKIGKNYTNRGEHYIKYFYITNYIRKNTEIVPMQNIFTLLRNFHTIIDNVTKFISNRHLFLRNINMLSKIV